MNHLAYVNGDYVPLQKSVVSINDRGYQFGDGVYEVVSLVKGQLVDMKGHLDRLERSLKAVAIDMPVSRRVLELLIATLAQKNNLINGIVYLQITRGVAPRVHHFHPSLGRASLVMTTKSMNFYQMEKFKKGVKVITIADLRWQRRDIKTINLLPNCLGKQEAVEQGAYEALQIDEKGYITEGTSSNFWIVTQEGDLMTRPLSQDILHGITRHTIGELAQRRNLKVVEKSFTLETAYKSKEAFLTSATSFATPVILINDKPIGKGTVGPIVKSLIQSYFKYATKDNEVSI